MKYFNLLFILLFISSPAKADPTWRVYVSTNFPEFSNSTEQVLSSTSDVKIELPTTDVTLSCQAWKPYYFQPQGFPYPLVQHRYLECNLGKDYITLIEAGCGLKQNDVKYANLILQTPKGFYSIILNCANFIEQGE